MSNKEGNFDPRKRRYNIQVHKREPTITEIPDVPQKSLLRLFADALRSQINKISMRISLRGGNPDHAREMPAVKRK